MQSTTMAPSVSYAVRREQALLVFYALLAVVDLAFDYMIIEQYVTVPRSLASSWLRPSSPTHTNTTHTPTPPPTTLTRLREGM